ncbi:hypothetical protein BJY04DRAFT_220336 [Aspergillus karnatakaensis]|uniref:uncharacterized protein n=1 Tax=Aspergillus karnatakaensis TaxID=1810916 RepID=UPI003CCE305A
MEITVDIAIIGYGPGGSSLASLLGQRGHRVAVLEKFSGPYNVPRMSTLDGEIARVLQHAADPDEALKESIPQPAIYMYGADGERVQRNDTDRIVCGHPEKLSLRQQYIEAAMHARVSSWPSVQVYWAAAVSEIKDLGDQVALTATTTASGTDPAKEIRVKARYAVGMDGGSSFVRQALGIPMNVLQKHDDEWLMTDFDIVDTAIETPRMELHMEELRTHASALASLKEKTGIAPEAVRITRQVVYRFRSEIAESMRVGNIFLGGDAAHLMTPGMAQGACSAIRDGINLAWRFDLVLTSRADAGILEGYEPERLAHVTPLVQGSLMAWRMATEDDPGKAAARDAFIRSGLAPNMPMPTIPTGFVQRTADGSIAPLAGILSPQGLVGVNGRKALLDNVVGFGFQLVSNVPFKNLLSRDDEKVLKQIGVHTVVPGAGGFEDLDRTYEKFLDQHEVVAYLSRPDFYIFGSAATADDIQLLVQSLAKELKEPTVDKPLAQDTSIPLPGVTFSHKTVPAAGFTIHYAEAGPSNPVGTIVSIPGSAGLEMSTAKDKLAERYRVVEINPPGWGDQADVTKPMPQSEIGMLLSEVVRQLIDEPFVLLATSMGGGNAFYLAAEIPDRVRGIILEGSMTPCRPQDLYPLSTTQPPAHPKKPWATPAYVSHQMANRMRMIQMTQPDMEAKEALATVNERVIPVLALLGEVDEVLKPSQQESVHLALPTADFQLVPGGRHDLQNTAPEEFVARVEAFIEERLV